jgi:eukaryotic-like serine/threonine-protein kinase
MEGAGEDASEKLNASRADDGPKSRRSLPYNAHLPHMSLLPGTRVGPYEIVAALGAGGMGEVYKARDTRLKRDVAIKALPETFASDRERLARFQREAEVLASLNHPHIAHIHGLEEAGRALVMEFVEGEDLAQKIARGSIPPDEALPIARQIAEALEAAHAQGIIHRDLKPANIMLRHDGTVKVLDFGLAKAMTGDAPGADLSQLPTITQDGTRDGMILGTPAYMSPEQARGKPVDKRTDIWAFGCVLYEMLTGRAVFGGDTISDTIAKILEREPDWELVPAATFSATRRLLRRCLEKEPTRRLHDIADARIEIEDAISEPAARGSMSGGALPPKTAQNGAARIGGRMVWMTVLAAVLAITAAVIAVAYARRSIHTEEVVQFLVLPPEGTAFGSGPTDRVPGFEISPDGRRLVFLATDAAGRRMLWIRSFGSLRAEPLNGTQGASFPFWSPDGEAVAFFADRKLKRVSVSGGVPITLCDAGLGVGGTWNSAGVIVFAPDLRSQLFRVSATGGLATPVTALRGDGAHVLPQFLPDGNYFLYLARGNPNSQGVYIASLDAREPKRVLSTVQKVLYASPGYLLFLRDATLMAQPFDVAAQKLSGEPVAVVESVAYSSTNGRAAYSVSNKGVLTYRASGIPPTSQLVWIDRAGKRLSLVGTPGDYAEPRLSPDESLLAAELHDLRTGTGDVWLLDLKRGSTSRVTFDGVHNTAPVWSPDSAAIVFAGRPDGGQNLHYQMVRGAGSPEVLLPPGEMREPTDWSSDGRHVLFQQLSSHTGHDLWVLTMPERKPSLYLQTPFEEVRGRFSPDGRWIAYVSNESGRDEVFVRPFPSADRKWQVSIDGGSAPQWRGDGKELFYVKSDGSFFGVSTGTTSEFNADRPQKLFSTPIRNNRDYSVSQDGQRFLVNPAPANDAAPAPPITTIINWTRILNKAAV